MAYAHYQTSVENWGNPDCRLAQPPTPGFQPRQSWGGLDYFQAHAFYDDPAFYQGIMSRMSSAIGVGFNEARHWHRRIYGGLVNLAQVLPADIGSAAAYEAYRLYKYRHPNVFEPLSGDYERQREVLIALAVAEATQLWQYTGRALDTFGRQDAAESAAATASRIARRVISVEQSNVGGVNGGMNGGIYGGMNGMNGMARGYGFSMPDASMRGGYGAAVPDTGYGAGYGAGVPGVYGAGAVPGAGMGASVNSSQMGAAGMLGVPYATGLGGAGAGGVGTGVGGLGPGTPGNGGAGIAGGSINPIDYAGGRPRRPRRGLRRVSSTGSSMVDLGMAAGTGLGGVPSVSSLAPTPVPGTVAAGGALPTAAAAGVPITVTPVGGTTMTTTGTAVPTASVIPAAGMNAVGSSAAAMPVNAAAYGAGGLGGGVGTSGIMPVTAPAPVPAMTTLGGSAAYGGALGGVPGNGGVAAGMGGAGIVGGPGMGTVPVISGQPTAVPAGSTIVIKEPRRRRRGYRSRSVDMY